MQKSTEELFSAVQEKLQRADIEDSFFSTLRNVYEDTSDFWHGSVPLNCAVNVVEVRDGKSRLLEEDKVYYGKEDCVNFYTADR